MGAPVVDITLIKGKTFEFAYRYAANELIYLQIEAMTSVAPVRLKITGHSIPDGWPIRVACVKSPEELNNNPNGDEPYYFAKVVDADTIELNSVNATCWKPYTIGGLVVLSKPVDMTGYSARMAIKDRVGGDVLLKLDSDPTTTPDGLIVIDTALSAFVLKLSATVTEALTWRSGVYDLEAITPIGEVYPIAAVSSVTVQAEVT
ncbi:MAG: hypothetical protein ACOH2R_08605 [Pseudomonas sp.]